MLAALIKSGRVRLSVGGTVAYHYAGLPMTADGELVVAESGDITHHSNGLPFTAAGAVRVSGSDLVDHMANGLPFTASGALAVGASDASEFAGGYGFTNGKRLSTAGASVSFDVFPLASTLTNAVRLEKLRSDFPEFAVYTPIAANGIDWCRWYFTNRINPGNSSSTRLILASIARLHPKTDVDRHAANLGDGAQAVEPVAFYTSADATARVGTWTAATTTGGVTGSTYSTTVGDYVEYTVTGGTRVAHRGYANAGVGGFHDVSITQGGVEIDASNRIQPGDVLSMREATGFQVAYIAKDLDPALTYVVRLTLSATTPASSRAYDAGILVYNDIAFDQVGLHGTYFDNPNGTPSVTYGSTRVAGTVAVYQIDDATSVLWNYFAFTLGGIARLTLFDAAGNQIATRDIDTYSGNALRQSETMAEGLPKGAYYLHVENLPIKNAASTRYQILDGGASGVDETAAGNPATDGFLPAAPPSGALIWEPSAVQGVGNLEFAMRVRKAANAPGVGEEFVGGVHELETAPASLTFTLDGTDITAAYTAAAAGTVWNGASLDVSFTTVLQFLDGGNFANVTYEATLNREGYRTDVTRSTLADAKVTNEYVLMVQSPKSAAFGGGFRQAQSVSGVVQSALIDDGSPLYWTSRESKFVIFNDAAAVSAEILNLAAIDAALGPIYGAPRLPFLQDRADNVSKIYIDALEVESVAAPTLPSGNSVTYQRLIRVAKR